MGVIGNRVTGILRQIQWGQTAKRELAPSIGGVGRCRCEGAKDSGFPRFAERNEHRENRVLPIPTYLECGLSGIACVTACRVEFA